jgi:hypothetical protein
MKILRRVIAARSGHPNFIAQPNNLPFFAARKQYPRVTVIIRLIKEIFI